MFNDEYTGRKVAVLLLICVIIAGLTVIVESENKAVSTNMAEAETPMEDNIELEIVTASDEEPPAETMDVAAVAEEATIISEPEIAEILDEDILAEPLKEQMPPSLAEIPGEDTELLAEADNKGTVTDELAAASDPAEMETTASLTDQIQKITGSAVQEALTEAAANPEETEPSSSAYSESRIIKDTVRTFKMQDWGVQFMCDLKWKVINAETPAQAQIILSEEPLVTIDWKKFDQNIRFLAQLNKFFFEDTGLYAQGFSTEKVDFAGHDAVLVKGYDKNLPDAQRRDYFYLHDNKLVSISFTLSPKDEWDQGKEIIEEVKESFAAMP